jgi:septum formation inhibitor MinC
VFGALLGQAFAGNTGDVTRVIAALDMNPEKLRIAGIKYKPAEKPKWTIKSKQNASPKLAHLDGTDIVFSPIDGNFWKRYYLDN